MLHTVYIIHYGLAFYEVCFYDYNVSFAYAMTNKSKKVTWEKDKRVINAL